jgi:hypothetical protein
MQDLTILVTNRASTAFLDPPTEDLLSIPITHKDPLSLLTMIHLTATIYTRAPRTPPVPFSADLNRWAVERLCHGLESTANDGTWGRFPGILIWILLVGSAATERGIAEHSYFVSMLMRVALGASHGWWDELSGAMKTFMMARARAEGRWKTGSVQMTV